VLEHKVPDPVRDDLEQLLDELLPLLERNVGLAAQTLPELLGARDDIGVGFSGFALQLESLLFGV
jgi:hypothetical protein